MESAPLFDHSGRTVSLGREVGEGGEGRVFEVAGDDNAVAKLYDRPPDAEKGSKLQAMVRSKSDGLLRTAAWPTATIHGRPGEVVGFSMPKVGGSQIHSLYGPRSRWQCFPRADWKFLVRTANHDRFGLAVLIFQRLFIGRHPFVGRFLGQGEMPLEEAIRQRRFAFGRHAARLQMAPPPDCLPLSNLPNEIGRLFEEAFGKNSDRPGARPGGAVWAEALKRLEERLTYCSLDRGHAYPRHVPECPWCGLMQRGGTNYFLSVAIASANGSSIAVGFSLAEVWRRIEKSGQVNWTYRRPRRPHVRPATPPPVPTPSGVSRTPPRVARPPILDSGPPRIARPPILDATGPSAPRPVILDSAPPEVLCGSASNSKVR